jgi:hypothetical protein
LLKSPRHTGTFSAGSGPAHRRPALAAFGDDTTAVLFFHPHTAHVSDAPTAECFTVADGKITRSEAL